MSFIQSHALQFTRKLPFNEKWWKYTWVELIVYCTFPNIHSTPFGFFDSTRPTVPNKVDINEIRWQKCPLHRNMHVQNTSVVILNNWAEAHNYCMLHLYRVSKFCAIPRTVKITLFHAHHPNDGNILALANLIWRFSPEIDTVNLSRQIDVFTLHAFHTKLELNAQIAVIIRAESSFRRAHTYCMHSTLN